MMRQVILIGIAAGAASALLFISFLVGPVLAKPLFYIATPLPILIAALGWSHVAGLTAVLSAAAALALIFGNFFFLSFLVTLGLPAWWLGYLALLGRPVANGGAPTLEWYPIGRLLLWAAILSGAIVALGILLVATDAEVLRTTFREFFEPLFRAELRLPRLLVEQPHLVLPPAVAVGTTFLTVVSVWLAARVVKISDRLRRPWPDLSAITLPPSAAPLMVLALAGSFLLTDMARILAMIFAATLLTAFGLLGLAILHTLTRGVNGRGLILGAVYGAIAVFGWPLLLAALLGLADTAMDLRGRAARRGPPPTLH